MSVKRNINNYFLRSLITKKVYHHLSGDMGGAGREGIMRKVTNCDIERGGLKFSIFAVTSFLNGSKPVHYKHY